MARTAIAAGGVAVTRVRATGVRRDRRRPARSPRVSAEDLATGADVRDPDPRRRRRDRRLGGRARPPVQGRRRCGSCRAAAPTSSCRANASRTRSGLTIRVPGKIVFLVPWPDHWLIGTTDAPFEGPPARPSAAGWEVDRLLDTVNATMDVDLTRADVVGTYAGLRPLIAPSDGSTVKASREHRVTVEPNGVVRIGGGKYTTYRVMARDVIDAVLGPRRGTRAGRATRPSGGWSARRTPTPSPGSPASCRPSRPSATVGPETAARLVARHGTEAPAVVALGAELDLLRPLVAGRFFLEAEVAWAVRHELALSLDDVLARRTRLAQELPDRGAAIAPRVAEIMAADLDWGDARQALEVEAYLASARGEFSVAPPDGPAPPTRAPGRTTDPSRGEPSSRPGGRFRARGDPKVRYWQAFGNRVPSRLKTPRKGPWLEIRSSTRLGLLSRLTRETRRARVGYREEFRFRVQRQDPDLCGLWTGIRVHRLRAGFLCAAWLHRAAPLPVLPGQPQGCPQR